MATHDVIVITDGHTADGFRLAGVETMVAESMQEAKSTLIGLLDEERVGIIAINQDWMDGLDERTRERIDGLYRPIVVAVPPANVLTEQDEERGARLARLIKRAVGFEIKLGDAADN